MTPKGQPGPLKPFLFLDVSVLREYLAVELSAPVHSFPFSLERAIDDWVFLIFFVGNDFLPHLPSLEIREGAIDTLMGIWKSNLERMGGYLTNHGKVELARAQIILEQLAMREDEIFRKRREGSFAAVLPQLFRSKGLLILHRQPKSDRTVPRSAVVLTAKTSRRYLSVHPRATTLSSRRPAGKRTATGWITSR